MDENKNNIDTLQEFIADTLNESINEAIDSFRIECYGIICQAINTGIEIGKTRYQPNNSQYCWNDINIRLPEEGKRVGVLTKDGAMFFGCVFNGSFPSSVTHWLEIPEIPKN